MWIIHVTWSKQLLYKERKETYIFLVAFHDKIGVGVELFFCKKKERNKLGKKERGESTKTLNLLQNKVVRGGGGFGKKKNRGKEIKMET